jgi:glucose/arabinose dehydrogenase
MRTTLAVSTTSFVLSLLLLAAPSTGRGDNIFVGNSGNNTIEEFNSSGVGTGFTSSGLNCPVGLIFDSAGNLYAANYNGNNIEEFNSSGVGSVYASGVANPGALVFDNGGQMFAVCGGNSVLRIVSGGGTLFARTRGPTPIGAAFDKSGNLYVSVQVFPGSGFEYIEKFSASGTDLGVFANSGLDYPTFLAFDKNGNLYVANDGNNTIEEFNTSGVGHVFARSGLDGPQCMAFDSAGNLYVANENNNTVEEFNTNGVGSVFASGLNAPCGLAIQVPEPSTWAMVAMGIGAVLGGLRLRRGSF